LISPNKFYVQGCRIEISKFVSDDLLGKEELANKNSNLEKNLQSVYVKSKGDVSTRL